MRTDRVAPATLAERLAGPNPPIVVDIRAPGERMQGSIATSIHVPLAQLKQRIAELRAEMQVGFATLSSAVDSKLAQLETRLTKRMFGFWVAQAATTAALVLGVVKLLH